MMKISNKKIINYISLIMPKTEKAEVELDILTWHLKLIIQFNDNGGKPNVAITGDSSTANITFENWTNSLGMSLVKPTKLGETQGVPVFFHPLVYQIGSVMKLEIQFMVEDEDIDGNK